MVGSQVSIPKPGNIKGRKQAFIWHFPVQTVCQSNYELMRKISFTEAFQLISEGQTTAILQPIIK